MRNLLTNLGFTILKSYPVTNKTEMELVRRHGAALDAKLTTHSLNVNARIRELSLDESLTIAQLNRITISPGEPKAKLQLKLKGN